MPERDGYDNGVPSWIDLTSTDVEASKAFYSALFGWEMTGEDTGDGGTYFMATKDGKAVAGMMQQGPDMAAQGLPSFWNTYINVDDIEASAAKATAAGANQIVPVMDVMETGRMAFFMDPQGAAFGMWQPGTHTGAGLVNEDGALTWNEVYAADMDATFAFYGAVFGWTKSEMPMPDGTYTMFMNGEDAVGGTMPPPMPQVPPHWHVWFASADTRALAEKVKELGGMVLMEPMDQPMGTMASFHDPTGAVFSVITQAQQG